MWQWECNQANQQSGLTCKNKAHWCLPSFHKRSSIKGDISIESVGTEDQLADIFTKPLDEKRFCKLRNELNILDFSNMCWCTPPLIWHASPSSNQGKKLIGMHTFFAKDLCSASSHSSCSIGSFMKIKWIWCLYGTTIVSMLDLI